MEDRTMNNNSSGNFNKDLSAYTPSSNPKVDIKDPLERIMPHLIDILYLH